MIVLTGASGFVGTAFRHELQRRGIKHRTVSRKEVDIYDRLALKKFLLASGAEFLINCAGYTGRPNVDACELHKTECLQGNAVLPAIIMDVCNDMDIPWGHVSSGCIYTGRRADGSSFTEDDAPNFSFRHDNCSFYSGTKALAEEIIADADKSYVWRLRIPFDHHDGHRNYLTKIIRYPRLLDVENSLSHLGEFVTACVDCWTKRIPYGIYNLTNPGSVYTRQVTEMIREAGLAQHQFSFFRSEAEFMQIAAKAPRSSCVLDSSKALSVGLNLSPVETILRQSLQHWIAARVRVAA